jgi:Zn-dependent protease
MLGQMAHNLAGWRLKVFSFSGIELYLHSTFIWFFGFLFTITWAGMTAAMGNPLYAFIDTIVLFQVIIVAYCSVIPHEYGHALTAQKRGFPVRDITLLPIGGMASIGGNWYENWRDEFWITVNGPLVNVVFALLAAPFAIYGNSFALTVLEVNMILLAFNLLPLHPMDGGRILRSLLNGWMGCPLKATIWTRRIAIGGLFIICPLLWIYVSPFTAFIVLLVAGLMGGAESRMVITEQTAKKSKSGGQLATHTTEWKELLEADSKRLWPDDTDKQARHVEQGERFMDWMGRVYMILASRSTGPEEVKAKAAKIMDYLKNIDENERLTFNTLELGEEEDDDGFNYFLTELFLEKHKLG